MTASGPPSSFGGSDVSSGTERRIARSPFHRACMSLPSFNFRPASPSLPLLAFVWVALTAATPPTARAQGATGLVEGHVEVSRKLTSRRPRFRIYAEPGATAAPAEEQAPDERSNIVIYIERLPASAASTAGDTAIIRQRSERFTPHVLPVVQGTTVAFPNDDRLYHNVFSLSAAKTFDLGRFPRGESRAVTFERPGVVQVFCHIHSDMSAVVLVLDNPYFAVPDRNGHYAIPELPPGEYTIVAFHERIRPIRHRVRCAGGGRARVDFRIPLPAANAATDG